MSKHPPSASGPIAVKNVAAFMAMTMRLIERDPHLPGIGVCHSPSGYGKTHASIFAQNKTRAIRVEVGDSWTRRSLLLAILGELQIKPRKRLTVPELAEEAIAALGEEPTRQMPYGVEFYVRDPDGYLLGFVQATPTPK